MTRFAVDWLPEALSDLANLWLRAPDRRAVTETQANIDQVLGSNPTESGRHLAEGLYQLRLPILMVTYTIDMAHHRVEINSVHGTP